MKIKRLNINSYGKISDKEIRLGPCLNVICGDNESGKTTIRSFIFGLFFAGTSSANRATYTKEYEKYIPWSDNRYEGSAIIEYQNSDYYIYRNFSKSKEKLSIFNSKDGSDAKSIFNIDTSKKVEKFSIDFFGINESTLRSLFEITDEYKMEETLSYDLKDRMINHFSTKSEDISVENIIKNIENYTFNKDDKKELSYLNNRLEAINFQLLDASSLEEKEDYFEKSLILDREIADLQEELFSYEEELNFKLEGIDKNTNWERDYKNLLEEKFQLEATISKKENSLKEVYFMKFYNWLYIIPIALFIYLYISSGVSLVLLLPLFLMVFIIIFRLVYSIFKIKDDKKTKQDLKNLYNELDFLLQEIRYNSSNKFEVDDYSYSQKLAIINNLKEEIQNKATNRQVLFEKIKNYDNKFEQLKALKEEKYNIENKIKEINYKKEMGQKSIEIINNLSRKKFENISDSLIEDCSEFLKTITYSKYTRLMLNDINKIMLFDNNLKRFVEIDSLSKGTIGQVYFAYKLGLIVNSGINFPIIIDDGFTLFDIKRNQACLKLLERIAEDYQILFFTSDYRYLENIKGQILKI